VSTTVQDPFLVGLERFQGPLDLLLHLIRKQDIDIFDIPIARITEQFLAVTLHIDRRDLDRAGEFLEMAATLVRIKAQMLFPRRVEEEDDDPRADLVRRLLEYEHFREAASLLIQSERDRARYLPKGYVEIRPVPPASDTPLETSWDEVWTALSGMVKRLEDPEPGYRISGQVVRVDEKIDLVLGALKQKARIEFTTLVAPWGTRIHAVISLLACLELAKENALTLRQASAFAPLWVYRRDGA